MNCLTYTNFTWLDNYWNYYWQIAYGAELAETRNMWASLQVVTQYAILYRKIHQKKFYKTQSSQQVGFVVFSQQTNNCQAKKFIYK